MPKILGTRIITKIKIEIIYPFIIAVDSNFLLIIILAEYNIPVIPITTPQIDRISFVMLVFDLLSFDSYIQTGIQAPKTKTKRKPST